MIDPQTAAVQRVDASTLIGRPLRYYDFVMAAFVAVLLLSNIIGASKLASVGGWEFGAGILFFPISYVLGDVLTEVYGYARARRVIWVGFSALLFLAVMSLAVVAMPPSAGWWCGGVETLQLQGNPDANSGAVCQATYESVFGSTWRIVVASIIAFWAGEFVNSIVMARMKLWTEGRMLWTRTIGSTFVGQGVDSLIFYPVAFLGIWTTEQVITVMLTNWALKVGWEAALTPVTYQVVGALKRREGLDVYDEATDFTPFQTRV
jgi:queuosine precursor transporter